MVFNRVKKSFFPTERKKRKARGERFNRRGITYTTVIVVDYDMPPTPTERRTRQNTARGNYVTGTIANNARKGNSVSGAISEGEGGDKDSGTSDYSGHSGRPQNANVKKALNCIKNSRGETMTALR